MYGEIITIGDELISGRVADQNSFFLAARLSSLGLTIKNISSVGDDPEQIKDVLRRALSRSRFVLVSGGLGPTDDDITAGVAADFFDLPLIEDKNLIESLKKALEEKHLPWIDTYRKFALIPEGACFIDPQVACGFYIMHGQIPVFFLPGVPAEVKRLAETRVLPLIMEIIGEKVVIKQRILKIFGLQEARIGEIIKGAGEGFDGLSIGFYPNFPENHLSLTVRAESEADAEKILNDVEAEVEQRLGRYIVARGEAGIEETVGELLTKRGLTIATAESCTGGLIARRLTSVSGSSNYFERGIVAYSNRAKSELLGVPEEIIEQHGAVSEQTAIRMAKGIREKSGTDLGLATTGIAGPTGGTPEKPVGAVYIALAAENACRVKRYNFSGMRNDITVLTSYVALSWLHRYLNDDSFLYSN